LNLCDRRLELPPDFAQAMDPEVFTEDVPDLERLSSDTRIINSVANFVRRHNCREILLALPWGDTSHIEFVRDQIKVLPVALRLSPDVEVRSLTNFRSSARQRVLAIEIQRAPLSGAQRFVKRIMDIFVGALALVFFLALKPGITGWAQCNRARGATPSIEHIAERVKLDLWYINNWSLWLGIQILIKTFFEILRKRNA
jgi:hypothetical protein